jgi:LysM repeat protein
MPTISVTVKIAVAGVEITTLNSYTYSGYKEVTVGTDELVGGATNIQVDWAFNRSRGKFFYMLASVDMTVKTNSTSAPGNTIALVANKPYYWAYDSGIAQPLAADVTTIYASVPGGSAGTLQVRSMEDATP